jgi:hypothetical protein
MNKVIEKLQAKIIDGERLAAFYRDISAKNGASINSVCAVFVQHEVDNLREILTDLEKEVVE